MTGAPYCGIWKQDRFIIVCASPERFIKKNGSILTTQPMKGTARRGGSEEEDALLCRQLMESPKERSELFMTVDVARNDLSRIAKRNSVKTEGLCEILTFPHIHQMISTISCVCRDNISTEEILKSVFPPASMTGAPKQRAMQLIEQYELGSRGFYSGCLGWIDEAGNFDTCVVIRSLVYDIITGNLSFHVGSAITAGCNPEKEWEECLLKANALLCSASTSLEQVIFHSEI